MKKALIVLVVIVVIAAVLFFALGGLSSGNVKSISVQEGLELTKNPSVVIVDIRTPQEYQFGHLANSILIDFYEKDFAQELDKLDKSKTYLFYCRTANRTTQAVKLIEELGFKHAYNMLGGINAWNAYNYPVVK